MNLPLRNGTPLLLKILIAGVWIPILGTLAWRYFS